MRFPIKRLVSIVALSTNIAFACDLQVTSTADDGVGSLREAVTNATADQEICFQNLTMPATIVLANNDINIGTGLKITGPGRDLLTIEGGSNRVFEIIPSATTVTITGMTIANSATGGGGAMKINGGTISLTNMRFDGNEAAGFDGGAIEIDGGTVTIDNTEFKDNVADDDGGALEINGATVTVKNSQFTNNEAQNQAGGAIRVRGGSTLIVEDSTFTANFSSTDDGGALSVEDASTTATVRRSTFSKNYSEDDGGAFHIDDLARLTLDEVVVSENYTQDDDGGAAWVGQGGELIIENSRLELNVADSAAGGVWLDQNGSLTVRNSIFLDNSDEGIYADQSSTVVVEQTTISDHSDQGIELEGGSTGTVTQSIIRDNSDEGILVEEASTLTVTQSLISGNSDQGIEVEDGSTVTVENSTISKNRDEGILLEAGASLTLRSSTISENYDQGINLKTDASAIVEQSTIIGNQDDGILVSSDAVPVTLSRSLIAGNGVAGSEEDIDVSDNHPDPASAFVSNGYNVIAAVGRVPFNSNTIGDLFGDNRDTTTPNDGATEIDGVIDPQVLPLNLNGADVVLTHALDANSPALNRIPIGVAGCGSTLIEDQRGVARPAKGACDVGAYENADVDSVYAQVSSDQYNPIPGEIVEVTVVLTNTDLTTAQTGISIESPLPAELTPVGSVGVVGGTQGVTGLPPNTLTGLELAEGETATVSYRARVDEKAISEALLSHRVVLTSDTQLDARETEIRLVVRPTDSDSDGVADAVDSNPNDPSLPEGYPARVYYVDQDNENNLGQGVPDEDLLPYSLGYVNVRHPIEFNIGVAEARPQRNAFLAIFADDVDFPEEFNEAYLNGVKLGSLVGANNLENTTLLTIPDTSIVKLGQNLVEIEVNVNNEDNYWAAAVAGGQLITDFTGEPINGAEIRTLAVDKETAPYGSDVTVTLEADTSRTTQDVRVELILRDAEGTPVAFDASSEARQKTLTGSSDDPHTWTFQLPATGVDGIWSVSAVLYDTETKQFSDFLNIPIAVPDENSAAPVVSTVSPEVGQAGAAVVIKGQNFVSGDTTCAIGGEPLANLLVIDNTQITANLGAGLVDPGSYDVQCTTSYGTDLLTGAFELRVRPRLEIVGNGSGTGVVDADLGAINCGATCADNYDAGSTVKLTAVAEEDSTFRGWSAPCAEEAVCEVTVTENTTITATFELRNEFDDSLPSGGEVSASSSGGGGNAWVFTESGNEALQTGGFIPVSGHPKSPAEAPPASQDFRWGLFDFVLELGDPGSDATVVISFPEPLPPDAKYWKYGATEDNPSPHWHIYPDAVIEGNQVTLTLTDGGRGDSDLSVNRLIQDPGGPAVERPPLPVNTLSERWLLMLMAMLLAGVAGHQLLCRSRRFS